MSHQSHPVIQQNSTEITFIEITRKMTIFKQLHKTLNHGNPSKFYEFMQNYAYLRNIV
jgi:hypothetical protein